MPPQAVSLAAIARLARDFPNAILCFAGTPVAQAAPNGVQEILRLRNQSTVSATIGLTLIKSAGAFTAPTFQTTRTFERVATQVQHFATVLRTTSADATHDSYYPAAGWHRKPPQAKQRQQEFWEISEELSEQIRQGEQEHLDDARRAYEITYKCIENAINRLATRKFGPAQSPDAATEMALAELGRQLSAQLGTKPADWVAALDRLLLMTKQRDTSLWHSIGTDSIRQEGDKVIEKLGPSTFFQVGKVPSSHVVRL